VPLYYVNWSWDGVAQMSVTPTSSTDTDDPLKWSNPTGTKPQVGTSGATSTEPSWVRVFTNTN